MNALADVAIYRLFQLPPQRVFFLTTAAPQAELFRFFLRIHNSCHVIHCIGSDTFMTDFGQYSSAPWFTGFYDFAHAYAAAALAL